MFTIRYNLCILNQNSCNDLIVFTTYNNTTHTYIVFTIVNDQHISQYTYRLYATGNQINTYFLYINIIYEQMTLVSYWTTYTYINIIDEHPRRFYWGGSVGKLPP